MGRKWSEVRDGLEQAIYKMLADPRRFYAATVTNLEEQSNPSTPDADLDSMLDAEHPAHVVYRPHNARTTVLVHRRRPSSDLLAVIALGSPWQPFGDDLFGIWTGQIEPGALADTAVAALRAWDSEIRGRDVYAHVEDRDLLINVGAILDSHAVEPPYLGGYQESLSALEALYEGIKSLGRGEQMTADSLHRQLFVQVGRTPAEFDDGYVMRIPGTSELPFEEQPRPASWDEIAQTGWSPGSSGDGYWYKVVYGSPTVAMAEDLLHRYESLFYPTGKLRVRVGGRLLVGGHR